MSARIVELSADEVHEAFVEWLKAHRPEEYAVVEGRQSALFCRVVADELVSAGFEVDE